MLLTSDKLYKEGQLWTFIYSLDNNKCEYIHCIITELIDQNIKVNQIHNLEKYYKSPKEYYNFSERILEINKIEKSLWEK